MRWITLLLALFVTVLAQAADYARERKWADEILPAVLVGDAVWLEQASGHKFLGLYTPVDGAKAAVLLVHGIGIHPDWGFIGGLRQQLPDAGYATLSIQMPILAADAKAEDYSPTLPEAAERLAKAVAYLKGKGYTQVAIVSHSLGCRMAYPYLRGGGDAQVAAWVAIGSSATDDLSRLKLPILDLYGANDLPAVVKQARTRAAQLVQKGSRQIKAPAADHFFDRQEAALLNYVRQYLQASL